MPSLKSPWMPFFQNDWQTDLSVRAMSLSTRGAYIELLCFQWREGELPDDDETLRRICGATGPEWTEAWPLLEPHFPNGSGARRNARLDEQRRAYLRKVDSAQAAGMQSGKSRRVNKIERSFNGRSHSVRTERERNANYSDPESDLEKKGLALKGLHEPKEQATKRVGGSRRRKPAAPPPDIQSWISWNKESKDLEITDENKRWLAHELRLHTDWLDAHDPPARGYFPKPVELQESLRNLRSHLLGAPFKTNAGTLPTLALNWFKNDLAKARTRMNGSRGRMSPAEKSEAAFQEAFRLIKQHKEMTDARKADQDRRDAPAISEGISKLKPDG